MTQAYSSMFMRALAHGTEHPPLRMMLHRDWNILWQLREHLVDRARLAALERGRSYRNFRVGAAVLLNSVESWYLHSLGRTDYVIYTGSNWKLGREARNTCAEQQIVAQIIQQTHMFPPRRILALVVAGESQNEPDAESGHLTLTLHPCHHCRKLLTQTPQMRPDTVIITVSLTTNTMEVTTFRDLIAFHSSVSDP